ncbi:MAG: response regulator [Arcobacter sp.]|nr:MAG: response regulator [Arcobacter sp.]
MNILIIEDEIYLAQKIVSRLLDEGHICDYIESGNIDNLTKNYDVVLLSTSLDTNLVKNILKKYAKNSIVLLLVSYISKETVTKPIRSGAKDYIMKPFIMDELVRKIYHYKDYGIDIGDTLLPHSFPTLIETNSQKYADKLVFDLAKKLHMKIEFVSLSNFSWQKYLNNENSKTILYFTDYHTLKKNAKDNFNSLIEDKNVVVCSLDRENDFPYRKIEIEDDAQIMTNSTIMTINDYVKLMVLSYQDQYPDTELSKKLGISRKSLWEKRKKFGIEKKK